MYNENICFHYMKVYIILYETIYNRNICLINKDNRMYVIKMYFLSYIYI